MKLNDLTTISVDTASWVLGFQTPLKSYLSNNDKFSLSCIKFTDLFISLSLSYFLMLMLTHGFFSMWLFTVAFCNFDYFGRRKLLTWVMIRANQIEVKEFLKENIQIGQYLLVLIQMDFHMLVRLDSILFLPLSFFK